MYYTDCICAAPRYLLKRFSNGSSMDFQYVYIHTFKYWVMVPVLCVVEFSKLCFTSFLVSYFGPETPTLDKLINGVCVSRFSLWTSIWDSKFQFHEIPSSIHVTHLLYTCAIYHRDILPVFLKVRINNSTWNLLICSIWNSFNQSMLHVYRRPQLSNLWWMPNSVCMGFDTAMKTGSSRRFKRYPTTYIWVSSRLPFTED